MAISFQNLFNNPFTSNGLGNLKPKINKESNDSGNKTGDKNADTQETKATINNEAKQSLLNISPIDKAHNSLANVMLRVLAEAAGNGNEEYANSMLESIVQNSKLPKSSANALGGSKNDIYAGSIFNAASIEFTQSITYTLSYNHQSGEYSQSLSYSSSFVATFNAEFTDKSGNKMATQNQLALGKNFENLLTNGQESRSSALKEFLEKQTFNVNFDGDLSEIGEKLQQGLNKILFLFEINDTTLSSLKQPNTQSLNAQNPQNENLQNSQKEMSALFANLQNILNSSLEMFVGIPKEEQNNPALADFFKNQNALTITASYEQYNAQWIGKKLDNSESGLWWYGSYSSQSASFKFEA